MQTTDLAEELRTRGYRVTQPRRAVWDVLQATDDHLTVDEVTTHIETAGHEVDPASVYRTLALFEELGLVRSSRLGTSDAWHWELMHPDEHFHLVCLRCNEVDHHVGSLVARIEEHLNDGHGFEVQGIELVVTGLCASCRRHDSAA